VSDLYQKTLVDHARHPRNFGPLPGANRHAEGVNPLCGDELKLWLRAARDRIEAISFEGQGCAVCLGSASMMTAAAKGLSRGEIAGLMQRVRGLVRGQDDGSGLGDLAACAFVQEALPESVDLKRATFKRLSDVISSDAIVASTSSTISPSHLADAVTKPERFLVAHWLNPAHIIPLVEVVPGQLTAPAIVERTLWLLERLGKTPVRCADSPGFIGPRIQVLLMNEAVRLVEEGVATPEDVDRAFRAGMGFRFASVGIFEFIDWGGVDILYRASRYMSEALGDDRFKPARLVERKMAYNELGPKTGRGFFDYSGERRETFETAKIRALLRQLKRDRESAR